MAVSRGAVLFLFLLVVAAEMGAIDAKMGVAKQISFKDKLKEKEEKSKEEEEKSKEKEESQPCLSQSLLFKGFCFDSDKCKEVCLEERFPGGECRRDKATRKCFCKKPC